MGISARITSGCEVMGGNKKREKEEKAQIRRQKKERRNMNLNNQDQDDCKELNNELLKVGLSLKLIPGDGNCLFRALGDQLDGNSEDHMKYRQEVVQYMKDHRADFEPFVEDDISFDRHLDNLSEVGTFGGNDSIVAFARLYDLTVVIHQLNKPLWQVFSEGGNRNKELHISYHNGDHYNSVRRCEDLNGSGAALVNLSRLNADKIKGKLSSGDESDSEISPNTNNLDALINEVRRLTEIQSEDIIIKALESNNRSPQIAAESLKNQKHRKSDLWSESGTGSRIIGNGMIPANSNIPNKLNSKQKKELKKRQRRMNKHTVKKSDIPNSDPDIKSSISLLKTLTI